MHVSPLFDKCFLLVFADYTFLPKWNKSLPEFIESMEKINELTTKWLRKSGLVVIEAKTEMCFFYKNDVAPISIVINNCIINLKK
jgi:hypothetical protein